MLTSQLNANDLAPLLPLLDTENSDTSVLPLLSTQALVRSFDQVIEQPPPANLNLGVIVRGEPPPKRQRTDRLNMTEADNDGVEFTRDEKYYIPEADCVIRVQDVLFRVHKFILTRDSSMFSEMFAIPSNDENGQTEGSSDDNPICLEGEHVVNFRSLLSVLYALPAELQVYSTPSCPVHTLLRIAQTTNKYNFASTETWAITNLYTVLTTIPPAVSSPVIPPLPDLGVDPLATPPSSHSAHASSLPTEYHLLTCSTSLLKKVIEVSTLCGHQRLAEHTADKWVERVWNREISPIGAMEASERYGLQSLMGASYYVCLMESGNNLDISYPAEESNSEFEFEVEGKAKPISDDRPPVSLTPAQKLRLLSGAFAIMNLWDRLSSTPPTFPRPNGCTYHAHGCVSTWESLWHSYARSSTTLKYRSVDVLARLKSMEEQLSADGDLRNALTPRCRTLALCSVRSLLRETREGLASYFENLAVDQTS